MRSRAPGGSGSLFCGGVAVAPRCKLGGGIQTGAPVQLQKSWRKRHEGPWVWPLYRAGMGRGVNVVSSRLAYPPPCFLTFVRRVHSRTFEAGIGAPRFLAGSGEWCIGTCIRIDRVMSARDIDIYRYRRGPGYKFVGRMRARLGPQPAFDNASIMIEGSRKRRISMVVDVRTRFHPRTLRIQIGEGCFEMT